ncbi:hypothetical protein NQ314_016095 [Rhamnusium bicolor]|uniref:Radial spoke head protein 9 homolog n=1 Tax=Rhamnusium bicolor TaxID=1586634 RepID=A0AAV8WX89_9CUCU|nr:hypothetical protein NQ314_016095 [Rhamnusium bicolor]
MNLDSILGSLESSGHFGHIISSEESIILHNSLLILQNENHFRRIFFWGKIFGAEKDYYVAYGYTRDVLHGRTFYYSMNCVKWGLLPQPTKNGLMLTPLCSTKFQGDPALKRKQAQIKKLKEEDRLATIIHLVTDEAAVIPRGALFRRPDGVIVENLSFEGLSALEAREIKSFLHLRKPTQKWNTNLLTREDYNYAMDFLDPLDLEIPEGCWMIQITAAEDLIILKSVYWPGMIFFSLSAY